MSSTRQPLWWQAEGWQTRTRPLWLVERNDGRLRVLGIQGLHDPQYARYRLMAQEWMNDPGWLEMTREWAVAPLSSLRVTIASRIEGNAPRTGRLVALDRELSWRRTGPPVFREFPTSRLRRFLPEGVDSGRDPCATRLWGRVNTRGEAELFSAVDLEAARHAEDEIEPVEALDLELARADGIYHPIRYRLELFDQAFEWSLVRGPTTPPKGPLAAELRLPIPGYERPRAVSEPAGTSYAARGGNSVPGAGWGRSCSRPRLRFDDSASP